MSLSTDKESEILLGNKQLLAVFGVVSVLLAIAFTGGYMVGKTSSDKKAAAAQTPDASTAGEPGGGITRTVAPGSTATDASEQKPREDTPSAAPPAFVPSTDASAEPPLGARKQPASGAVSEPTNFSPEHFTPQPGQTFLQVAAVGKEEADAVADVLHRKGFSAYSVPKPGNAKIYRVLIGPLKDAADLANTRDLLRNKAGFREVITQHY